MLNDKTIRLALKKKLIAAKLEPSKIIDELAVKRGLAIADVVANYKIPHCFEIKSDVDSLSRLKKQSDIFSEVFPKVTLVTTSKHLSKALAIIPDWWGVIIAQEKGEKVLLKYYRKSLLNKQNTTKNLLTILWNSELKSVLTIASVPFKQGDTRQNLVNQASKVLSQKKAEEVFVDALFNRKLINRI